MSRAYFPMPMTGLAAADNWCENGWALDPVAECLLFAAIFMARGNLEVDLDVDVDVGNK